MDIDDIKPGQDFKEVLRQTLSTCQVLLVLIGPRWLEVRDEQDERRLEDEQDFVRLEVETALKRGLPVIPVLVNRAVMPDAEALPVDIRSLANHQALEVSDSRFHDDVNNLIDALEQIIGSGPPKTPVSRFSTPLVVAMVTTIILAILWVFVPLAGRGPTQGTQDLERASTPDLILRGTPDNISSARLIQMLIAHNFYDTRNHPAGKGIEGGYEFESIEDAAVVRNSVTGLMWQHSGIGTQQTQDSALEQVKRMNERGFGGFTNWRLPTLEEAMSLLTPATQAGMHASALLTPGDSPVIWTADLAGERAAWLVYLYDGTAGVESPVYNAWARAVRSTEQH